MRTSLRPAVTRRSFLLAFLSPLRASRPQHRRPQAARMTMVDGWARFFLWCGFVPAACRHATA